MIRAVILAATIAALISLYLEEPPKAEPRKPVVEVHYCPVMYWKWIKIGGRQVKLWFEQFGPCKDMDRYEWA